MLSQLVKITNPTGLQVQAAGELCKEAMQFKSRVCFEYKGNEANAKSVLSVLGACVHFGDTITLICDGEDEAEALAYLSAYIEDGFKF